MPDDYKGDWVVIGFTFATKDADGKEVILGKLGGYKMMSDSDPRLSWRHEQWLANPQAFDWSTPVLKLEGCIFLTHALSQIMLNLLQRNEVSRREVGEMWRGGLEGINLDPEAEDDKG